jgi:hypothetical protein
MINFESFLGKIRQIAPIWIQCLLLLLLLFMAYITPKMGIMAILFFGGILPGLFLLYFIVTVPKLSIYMVFVTAYLIMGITRYIPASLGVVIDGMLGLCWIVLIVRGALGLVPWKRANQLITWLALLWFLYLLMEIFNPLVPSKMSWIYSARGMGIYFLLAVPLTLVIFDRQKDWEKLITIWGGLTLFAVAKMLIQKYIGFDPFEISWLNDGNDATHVLNTGIRYFSIFSDAGQGGATMAHSGTVFLLLALGEKRTPQKLFLLVVSLGAFWAMGLTGTRGAMAVPLVGVVAYVILCKNFKYIIIGSILLAFTFVFFRYTYIGQSNYAIQRMRSAFNPTTDASLNTRLINQKKFAVYLADKPFGCGLGTASGNGLRFYPNSYLASIPTDSWYVLIWAETGIVGVCLYISIMITILAYGSLIVFFRIKQDNIRNVLIAFISGGSGILVAAYGNAILAQFPTNIIFPVSMAYIFMAQKLDKKEIENG